jgi:hypothetical protein
LKRFFAPEWVFIFGMTAEDYGRPGAESPGAASSSPTAAKS